MWWNWLPWRWVVRRVARSHGMLDPIAMLAQLHRFAQPSEVAAPLELLRAGVVFHARGLMNTGAIQHNLDWVWPYWVERQFDPADPAFIPRAFSITHVNLTHRNWTAVGIPDCDSLPIVDPHGLLTPHWDGWSLDGWIVTDSGRWLLPSQLQHVDQHVEAGDGFAIVTESEADGLSLNARAEMQLEAGVPSAVQRYVAHSDEPAWLVVSLRPYNPEGVSFVRELSVDDSGVKWNVNAEHTVVFSEPPEGRTMSDYRGSDVHMHLPRTNDRKSLRCEVGMATGAALYRITPGEARQVSVRIPLPAETDPRTGARKTYPSWPQALAGACQIHTPDAMFNGLYDIALRTLILHSPYDIYPGPYTYKRFWFRDAALMLNAMLAMGLTQRAERTLDLFPSRQTHDGYFRSQEGEWDSNGEALWVLWRFGQLTGRDPKPEWHTAIARAVEWIIRKRLSDSLPDAHAGLLPAGFSAEHLGPNDYYYWDDFWSVAGLECGAEMLARTGQTKLAERARREAVLLREAIERSLKRRNPALDQPGIPASPYRRMDAGAIGSLAAGYPLQVWPADDRRLLDTVDFLIAHSFYKGGFFQDMIHSGVNAYLTLHVAQVLLRAGQTRALSLVRTVAELASPTGQWPEAIHPRTLGGCMGDGQHAWAAAEWLLMLRNCFVLEETDRLVLGAGIDPAWLEGGQTLRCGPTPTRWGTVSVEITSDDSRVDIEWRCEGRTTEPPVEVRLPGFDAQRVPPGTSRLQFERATVK